MQEDREGKFTVDKTPENDDPPELIRQRLSTIAYLALRILAREGKLQSGLTEDQIRQMWEQRNPWARYRDRTPENTDSLQARSSAAWYSAKKKFEGRTIWRTLFVSIFQSVRHFQS